MSTPVPITIVLSVPGPWRDLGELASDVAKSVASTESSYMVEGTELVNGKTAQRYPLELVDHDTALRHSFAGANPLSFTPADLALIDTHERVVYLSGEGGSPEAACAMMQAGAALLRAGGYAIKVESAGTAHSSRDWLVQTQRCDSHAGALYIAYVALISGNQSAYSCGMHNLGFADAIVSRSIGTERALELLRGFLMGVVHDPPTLVSGESTILDENGNTYTLTHEPCLIFQPYDPFYNPFGMWRLTRA